MDVDIKIVTNDYELVFDLVQSRRFPERKQVECPGGVILTSQNLKSAGEGDYSDDIIEITASIGDDSSVEEFSRWFFHTLVERDDAIKSLVINGAEIELDEDAILQAINKPKEN